MNRFTYPANLIPDEEDGGFTVTFDDFPEAITQGENRLDAIEQAADCLEEAVAGRINRGETIPRPSHIKGRDLVAVPLPTAGKAAVYMAMREAGITKLELAQRLDVNEKEARRILDPHHNTRSSRIHQALRALGVQVELRMI